MPIRKNHIENGRASAVLIDCLLVLAGMIKPEHFLLLQINWREKKRLIDEPFQPGSLHKDGVAVGASAEKLQIVETLGRIYVANGYEARGRQVAEKTTGPRRKWIDD